MPSLDFHFAARKQVLTANCCCFGSNCIFASRALLSVILPLHLSNLLLCIGQAFLCPCQSTRNILAFSCQSNGLAPFSFCACCSARASVNICSGGMTLLFPWLISICLQSKYFCMKFACLQQVSCLSRIQGHSPFRRG